MDSCFRRGVGARFGYGNGRVRQSGALSQRQLDALLDFVGIPIVCFFSIPKVFDPSSLHTFHLHPLRIPFTFESSPPRPNPLPHQHQTSIRNPRIPQKSFVPFSFVSGAQTVPPEFHTAAHAAPLDLYLLSFPAFGNRVRVARTGG